MSLQSRYALLACAVFLFAVGALLIPKALDAHRAGAPESDWPGAHANRSRTETIAQQAALPVRAVEPAEVPIRIDAHRTHSVLDESAVRRLTAIAAAAPERRNDVFAKIGGSTTVTTSFLHCFASADVDVSGRESLNDTVAFFRRGRAGSRNPFERFSLAAGVGWSARQILNGHPSRLIQEIQAISPRFAFLLVGGNDVEGRDPLRYAQRLRRIARTLMQAGVIPILGSTAPRVDPGDDVFVLSYNRVTRGIAHALGLPFIDYHRELVALPGKGLARDGVHPNVYVDHGKGQPCEFDDEALRFGNNVRNLLSIEALDRLRRAVLLREAPPDVSAPALEGEGTGAAPYVVAHAPFSHLRSLQSQPLATVGASCPKPTGALDQAGNVYRMVVDAPLQVHAALYALDDVKARLALVDPLGSCALVEDNVLSQGLAIGTWHWVVMPSAPVTNGSEYLFVLEAEGAEDATRPREAAASVLPHDAVAHESGSLR